MFILCPRCGIVQEVNILYIHFGRAFIWAIAKKNKIMMIEQSHFGVIAELCCEGVSCFQKEKLLPSYADLGK